VPLAKAPQWLVDLIRWQEQAKGPQGEKKRPAAGENEQVQRGGRNAALTSLAGKMRKTGIEQAAINAALQEENRRVCVPPLDTREVERIATSVCRYAPAAEETPLTDSGNAEMLAARVEGSILFCHDRKKWLRWDGARWDLGMGDATITQLALDALRKTREEAESITDHTKKATVIKWTLNSESKKGREAMVALARSEKRLAARAADFDCDPWVLNLPNGVLCLKRGELRPHDQGDRHTKIAGALFDPNAGCPTFERFVTEIMGGNTELVEYLRRLAGYALTGSTKEQMMSIWHGGGRNGKSTLLELLCAVLKDYAGVAPEGLLLTKRQDAHPTELAKLKGLRLAVSQESGDGRHLAESRVKWITGSDTLTARGMREDFYDFSPTHKLILSTNYRPKVQGSDAGIWRRLQLLPFQVEFPPGKADKDLPQKLRAELPGVLAWCVKGCLEWQERGLDPPQIVVAATQEYRTSEDAVTQFIRDCCEIGGYEESAAELFRAWRQWHEEQGLKAPSATTLGRRLSELGYETRKSRGLKIRTGLRLIKTKGTVGDRLHEKPYKGLERETIEVIGKTGQTVPVCPSDYISDDDVDSLLFEE
jgi:putative DNA primase/helicase